MNLRAAVGGGLATVALLGGGCGTVRNLEETAGPKCVPEMPPDAPMKRVYGGVRSDWAEFRRDPEPSHTGTRLSTLIDLSFSAVGDTLTLPYVLAWEKGFFGTRIMEYPHNYTFAATDAGPPDVKQPDAPK